PRYTRRLRIIPEAPVLFLCPIKVVKITRRRLNCSLIGLNPWRYSRLALRPLAYIRQLAFIRHCSLCRFYVKSWESGAIFLQILASCRLSCTNTGVFMQLAYFPHSLNPGCFRGHKVSSHVSSVVLNPSVNK